MGSVRYLQHTNHILLFLTTFHKFRSPFFKRFSSYLLYRLSVLCLALSLPSHSNLFIGKSFMATYLYCFAFNYHTVSITFNFCPCATFSVSGKNNSFLTPPPSTMTVSNRSFKDVLLVQPAITCPASSTYAPHDQGQRATPPISQVPTFSECNLHISSSYNDDFPPIQKRTATTT